MKKSDLDAKQQELFDCEWQDLREWFNTEEEKIDEEERQRIAEGAPIMRDGPITHKRNLLAQERIRKQRALTRKFGITE